MSAGFLALAAVITEARSAVLFQSWSLLFSSGCIAASCLPRNKARRTLLRSIGITEILLTFSITQAAKTTENLRSLRSIQLNHPSLFGGSADLSHKAEFALMTGRKLIPNRFGHTADGFRRVPDNPKKFTQIINVYGGSTTYDVGVTESESWANQLQRLLISQGFLNTKVRNLGLPGGTTSEAIIYSSFNDTDNSIKPSCSIHYHGWNDLRNNYVPELNNSYSNWHLSSMAEKGSIGSHISTIHGIINLAASKIWTTGQLHHILRPNISPVLADAPQKIDPKLETIYKANLHTLITLGERHGGKVIIAAQILNPSKLKEEGRYGWLPNVDDRNLMTLIDLFNNSAQDEAMKRGANIASQIKQSSFIPEDFVDNGHFSVKGSKKFASLLLPDVLNCINNASSLAGSIGIKQ